MVITTSERQERGLVSMMRYGQEIAANLERAERSIQAAKELSTGGYYDFVASRAYYGAFYAARAILLDLAHTGQ